MSEEIKNATTVVPRSIVYGLLVNGSIGFATLIATLFCIGDLDAITGTDFTYPFIAIYVQATQSKGGSAAMVALILLVGLGLDIGIMAAASRMLWSFARDRGVPGWRYISQVRHTALLCMPRSKAQLTLVLGGCSDENPVHCCHHHDGSLGAPWFHQHRFCHCLQRCSIAHLSGSLRILPHSMRSTPLAKMHRLYQTTPTVRRVRYREVEFTRQRR